MARGRFPGRALIFCSFATRAEGCSDSTKARGYERVPAKSKPVKRRWDGEQADAQGAVCAVFG